MRARVRIAVSNREAGFGLIELLIAMTVLTIGIFAIAAAFSSGAVALRRASRISTAGALADAQLERYRALTYSQIALDTNDVATGVDNTYKCDSALGGSCPNSTSGEVTITCTGLPPECEASRTTAGADGINYRVDTYIVYDTPSSGRQYKKITVVVRDSTTNSVTYARVVSTFDQATGS